MSRRVALQSNARDICAFIYVVTCHNSLAQHPRSHVCRFKTAKAVFVAGSSGAVIHLNFKEAKAERKAEAEILGFH